VHGFRTRFLLYTVPGQVFYNATRKLVLKGADAVVFVADSGLGKMDDNRESLHNLEENLREQGLSLESIPWVIQYNKRDLPQAYSVQELEAALNPRGVPSFEAAAASGQGVYETLHAVSRALFQRLMTELRPAPGRQGAAAPGVSAPAPVGAAPTARPVQGAARTQPARPAPPEVLAPVRAAGPVDPGFQGAQPRTQAAPLAAPSLDDLEASVAPQLFGASTSHVPAMPTPAQILDSVQASASALDAAPVAEPGTDYGSYGHIVDLSVELGESAPVTPQGGFIKDPLRRSEPAPARPGAPVRTQHVQVVVSRAELKQGGTIRLVVDLKLEA
jgi:hypothetical protein